jgi:hypothetical protein
MLSRPRRALLALQTTPRANSWRRFLSRFGAYGQLLSRSDALARCEEQASRVIATTVDVLAFPLELAVRAQTRTATYT